MTPDERKILTREIPVGLQPEEVEIRKSNFLLAHNHPLETPDWGVSIRHKPVPGLYRADDAALLRAQILQVSEKKAVYLQFKTSSLPPSPTCPLCGARGDGTVCGPCMDAYQLQSL